MHQGKIPRWGVWLIAAWALVLAILVFVEMLNLTQAIRLNAIGSDNQTQIWIFFILSTSFSLAFLSSTYGLWRTHNWGRLLFIWTNVVWSCFNITALFIPTLIFASANSHTALELTTSTIRFTVSLIIPLVFLNLPRVKALFYNNSGSYAVASLKTKSEE